MTAVIPGARYMYDTFGDNTIDPFESKTFTKP